MSAHARPSPHLRCQHSHIVPLELWALYRELELVVQQTIGILPAGRTGHKLCHGEHGKLDRSHTTDFATGPLTPVTENCNMVAGSTEGHPHSTETGVRLLAALWLHVDWRAYRCSAATSAAVLSEPAGAAMVSRKVCAAAWGLPRLPSAKPSNMGATMMLMFSSPLQHTASHTNRGVRTRLAGS
jgi:hypothetical protein